MDEAVLESNHTFVSIKKTSCSTYIYAVREYVRSAKVVLWLGMTGVVGVEVVGGRGGGWKVDYSCQALRSARREFKSCWISFRRYKLLVYVRNKMKKAKMTYNNYCGV